MTTERTKLLDLYMKEYETVRGEILLRLKEKNTLVRYMILLVSAVIAGLWKGQSSVDQIFFMIVLLFIIPFMATLLSFIYNWHDGMIAVLSSYIQNEIRRNVNELLNKTDLLSWDEFLLDFRKAFGWKTNAIIMRLIFIAPIAVSIIGYFMIKEGPQPKWIEITLVVTDLLCLVVVLCYSLIIDRKYRDMYKSRLPSVEKR